MCNVFNFDEAHFIKFIFFKKILIALFLIGSDEICFYFSSHFFVARTEKQQIFKYKVFF